MEDLIFTPIKSGCPKCREFVTVSLEALDDNDEIICPKCGYAQILNADIDKLIKLMKKIEESKEGEESFDTRLR